MTKEEREQRIAALWETITRLDRQREELYRQLTANGDKQAEAFLELHRLKADPLD